MVRCASLSFIFFTMSLWFHAAQAKEYQFIWNPYCPYTCDAEKEDGREGVAIDIIREIFKSTPHTVTFKRIDSWLRAKRLVASGVSDGMAFTFYDTKKEESGFMMPISPLIVSRGAAYLSLAKNKNNHFKMLDLAQFNMIGIYRGSVRDDDAMMLFLRKNPDKIISLTGTNILGRVSQMLEVGRLDIWVDSADLLHYFVSKRKDHEFTVSEAVSDSRLYGGMMFSSASPTATVLEKIIADGLKRLRKRGKLNQLLAVYGMQDHIRPSSKLVRDPSSDID